MTVTAGDQKLRPRSGRKPLQPIINSPVATTPFHPKPKAKHECIDSKNQNQNQNANQVLTAGRDLNNENQSHASAVTSIESLDSSLAEELSVIKKKLERLRLDKERTEKMLSEREEALDLQIKELQSRGEIQKMLEIEVDRLFRLKELKSYCMRISSIRTLREKEQEKKMNGPANSHELNLNADDDEGDDEESVGENNLQSPCLSSPESIKEKEN